MAHWKDLYFYPWGDEDQSIVHSRGSILDRCLSSIGYGLSTRKRNGSILILVLWSLFFLSALAIAVNTYIWPQLSLAGRLRDRSEVYYLAKAGVEKALLQMDKDETDAYDALNAPWINNEDAFKEKRLGNGTFSIKYEPRATGHPSTSLRTGEPRLLRYGLTDEERKLNINKVPYGVLRRLFEIVAEVNSQDASDIAYSMIDWRDEDDEPGENGAEEGYYKALNPPYVCRNEDFEVLEEILLVKGMTHDIFNSVKDKITLYGIGSVNINTADTLVLNVLGMDEDLAEKIIDFREGSDGREASADDNIFESSGNIVGVLSSEKGLSSEEINQLNGIVNKGLFSVRSDNFMGNSFGEIKEKNASTKIVFVFNRNKVIKYWKED